MTALEIIMENHHPRSESGKSRKTLAFPESEKIDMPKAFLAFSAHNLWAFVVLLVKII
jgi:hypothetical protein